MKQMSHNSTVFNARKQGRVLHPSTVGPLQSWASVSVCCLVSSSIMFCLSLLSFPSFLLFMMMIWVCLSAFPHCHIPISHPEICCGTQSWGLEMNYEWRHWRSGALNWAFRVLRHEWTSVCIMNQDFPSNEGNVMRRMRVHLQCLSFWCRTAGVAETAQRDGAK